MTEAIRRTDGREVWRHGWNHGGVVHTFTATTAAFHYRRGDLAGLIEVTPTGTEPEPGALSVGHLVLISSLVEMVSERSLAAHRQRLATTADAFREANLALEADEAPPVHDLPALAGVLVRGLHERREYADACQRVQHEWSMSRTALDLSRSQTGTAHDDLRNALEEAGQPVNGTNGVQQAIEAIRRMGADLANLRARDKDENPGRKELNAALHEAGEPAGGLMLATAAQVIRRLLVENRKLTATVAAEDEARVDLCRALDEALATGGGTLLGDAARAIRRLFAASKEPAPFDYMKVMQLIGTTGTGRFRTPVDGKLPITFVSHDGDRPELRALDREQLGIALAKLCRLYNDAEHAEEAEKTLADLDATLDRRGDRKVGESTLDAIARVIAEREHFNGEAQALSRNMAIVRDTVSSARKGPETAIETIQRLVKESAETTRFNTEIANAISRVRTHDETPVQTIQRLARNNRVDVTEALRALRSALQGEAAREVGSCAAHGGGSSADGAGWVEKAIRLFNVERWLADNAHRFAARPDPEEPRVEDVLATYVKQFEDAVAPVRRTGDTVLGTVQRLADEQVTRDVEAYDRGAFLGTSPGQLYEDAQGRTFVTVNGAPLTVDDPTAGEGWPVERNRSAIAYTRSFLRDIERKLATSFSANDLRAIITNAKTTLGMVHIEDPAVARDERKQVLASVALCHATLKDVEKRLAGLADGFAGKIAGLSPALADVRNMVAAAGASLESIPFTPHVDGPNEGEAPSVVESPAITIRWWPNTGPVRDCHASKGAHTVIGTVKRRTITGVNPSDATGWQGYVYEETSTFDPTPNTVMTWVESKLRQRLTKPTPSEPTFTWEPVQRGDERFCKATFGDAATQGCIRSVHAGKGWAGFANRQSLGTAWPDAMSETQAMRWVERQLTEELARLVLEKSAPLGAKAATVKIHVAPGADYETLHAAITGSATTLSPSTYDEDEDDGTSGSSR